MAYEDIVRGERYDAYLVFRGNFTNRLGAVTNAYVVGDRYVIRDTGRINGRARFAPIQSGIPDALGAPPEKYSTTIEIDNSDYSFSDAIIGTTSGLVTQEYKGDSVLNLKGVVFHGVRDPATGGFFENAITPMLYCTAEPDYDGQKISLPFSSRDDALVGPSYRPITLRMLLDSVANGDGTRVNRDGTTAAVLAAAWAGSFAINDNLEELAPWVYGRTAIPLLRCMSPETPGNDGRLRYVVGVFDENKEPYLEDFAQWIFFSETYGRVMPWSISRTIAPDVYLDRIKRDVTLPDGTTTTVWVVMLHTWEFDTSQTDGNIPDAEIVEKQQYVIPKNYQLGLASTTPRPKGTPWGPAKIIEEMLADHSGTATIDSASFTRTKNAIKTGGFGGVYYGDTPLADIFSHIQEAAGIVLWTDVDSLVHVAPNAGWNSDDKALAESASTVHIRQTEIVEGWKETIPRDPVRRGAPSTKVELDWPEGIRKAFGSVAAGGLIKRAPGASVLPIGGEQPVQISAAWVYPIDAVATLKGAASRRNNIRRRISFVGRAWFASVLKGTIFYLSHVRGLGAGGSTGYDRRVVRLERCTYNPQADLCELEFEDLGSVVNVKTAKLDQFSNWLYASGSGNLNLVSGSANANNPAGIFTAAMVGRYLDTSGAVNRGNKRQRQIIAFVDAFNVTVERIYTNNETIAAGLHVGSVTLQKWYVSRAHTIEGGNAFRPEWWRMCSENGASASLMRNANQGWQFGAG